MTRCKWLNWDTSYRILLTFRYFLYRQCRYATTLRIRQSASKLICSWINYNRELPSTIVSVVCLISPGRSLFVTVFVRSLSRRLLHTWSLTRHRQQRNKTTFTVTTASASSVAQYYHSPLVLSLDQKVSNATLSPCHSPFSSTV